jgi:hypothetical protein
VKPNLSEWASIGELVSGVAVVVTLFVLILGIRANTEITKASVYESNINSLMQWRNEISRDREAAILWETYQSGEYDSLDPVDQSRMLQMAANGMNVYEKAYYFAREYDVMGESEYGRFERMACAHFGWANQNQEMIEVMDRIMTERFMSYLRETCVDSD